MAGREEAPSADPTVTLLSNLWNDPRAWKHRLVYRVAISTVTHARVESHYQLVVPPALVESAGFADTNSIRALLPLSWRPKELLLNVRANASTGEPVHLLTRNEIAALHADRVAGALWEAEPRVSEEVWQRRAAGLEAIARTMPRRARVLTEEAGGLRSPEGIVTYLNEGLGFEVDIDVVRDWMSRLKPAETDLWRASPKGQHDENVACNFLLALPELGLASSMAELDRAIADYVDVVELAVRLGRPYVDDVARLGVEWPLIVDTEIPPARSVTVVIAEDRPLPRINLRSEPLTVPVPTDDAASLHVETQLQDSSALLDDVKMVGLAGQEFPQAEDVRDTMDRHAVYVSAPVRPAAGRLEVRVRLAGDVKTANRVVAWLAGAALVIACLADNNAALYSLLVIPVTLAVSVVQVRERTSLVRALTGSVRFWLVAAALALWGVVVGRLLVQSNNAHGLLGLVS